MADLSKLSDEQLAVYRDLIAKKQSPPVGTRPHVPGLDSEPDNFITSPNGMIRTGVRRAGEGIAAMSRPGLDAKLGAGSEILRGVATAATPAAIPFMAANPLMSAARLALGTGAQYVGEEGSKAIGLPPGASQLIGDTAGIAGAGFPGKNTEAALGGATRAGMAQVRPVLDKASIWHPLKNIGLGYDAIKNTVQGARDAVNPPSTSPFDVRSVKSPPSSGGTAFNPRPVEGGGGENLPPPTNIEGLPNPGNTGSKSLAKRLLKNTPEREVRSTGRNDLVGSGGVPGNESGPSEADIPGGQSSDTIGRIKKQLNKFTKDTSGEFQGHPKVWQRGFQELASGGPETTQVRPVTRLGTQLPERPANAPSASQRNVIFDEKSEPVAYDDPENPYQGPGTIRPVSSSARRASDQLMQPGTEAPNINQPEQEIRLVKSSSPIDKPYEQMQRRRASDQETNPDDVFTKIAQEGLEKRTQDAKAKYDDVYNNVIKGQYTPEQIRASATDPELKTQLDMKVKSLKFPSEHPKAGKAKYSSGLNPDVIDHLASRLEAENP